MIHPFSGNCMWRRGMGEGWTLASAFWGSGQLCPCRLWAHPADGAVLGCPQKLLCHPPLLHPWLGTLSPFCFWRTHLHVLSPLQAGGAPGGWGHKVSHHHHRLHWCITPKAEDWSLISTALSLVISRSPSFWDGSHATVCHSPLFLLWKYQFSFVTQLPQSSFGTQQPLAASESLFLLPGAARGDNHSQSPAKTFYLTRGDVMVRSGTAHPKASERRDY